MARISVTPELANTIRTLRLDNKVSAKDLAAHLGKSASYLSKLENGQVQTISREDLDSVFRFIIPDEAAFDEIVNQILSVSSKKYDRNEIEKQIWFSNYDTVYCKRPISEELVDEINELLREHLISREYLRQRINANEFLLNEFGRFKSSNEGFPKNEWFVRETETESSIEILIDLSEERLNRILDKEVNSEKYVFVKAIVLYLFKIIYYKEMVYIPTEDVVKLESEAKSFLAKHKFYSISEREDHENKPDEVNIHDKRAREEVSQLFSRLQFISNLDVQYTNEVFSTFSRNIDWDKSFILGLMALPFHRVGDISHSETMEMYRKIKRVLEEVLDKPKDQQTLDKYEF